MGKLYDGIMGLVVGDAFGVPFEFKVRDSFTVPDNMVGFGTYNMPAGTWSDDSSMTLATLESLKRVEYISFTDIMDNFLAWFNFGKFTQYGEAFDIGNTTFKAIRRYENGFPISRCGCRSVRDNGNGALMRILPLAFFPHYTFQINDVCALTHNHDISKMGCRIYIEVAKWLYAGEPLYKMIANKRLWIKEYKNIYNLPNMGRNEIKSSGYVVDTLEAALWCLLKTNNYRDCIKLAVGLGGDTDTIAAVAGGLAGIIYGVGGKQGIPEDWIAAIPDHKYVKELCGNGDMIK